MLCEPEESGQLAKLRGGSGEDTRGRVWARDSRTWDGPNCGESRGELWVGSNGLPRCLHWFAA